METNKNNGVEFIYAVVTTIMTLMSYLLLFMDTSIYISTLLYILPCVNESLRSLTVDKYSMGKRLVFVNWLALIASIFAIAACFVGQQLIARTTIPINSIIRATTAIYIIRNISYVIWFWRRV